MPDKATSSGDRFDEVARPLAAPRPAGLQLPRRQPARAVCVVGAYLAACLVIATVLRWRFEDPELATLCTAMLAVGLLVPVAVVAPLPGDQDRRLDGPVLGAPRFTSQQAPPPEPKG